jgi:hypothetical protein
MQDQIRCMCETQKALQSVMQAVSAARWQKHCKAMITLCWYVMRVRREEILMDVTLLTAAQYFKHIVPLQLTHNSMRDRLARHYLQIFVTLLRTSASEHDQMLVFDAVDAMMPCMEVYAGPTAPCGSPEPATGSQPAPIWLNYVRKCMMDYTESPGISSRACPPLCGACRCSQCVGDPDARMHDCARGCADNTNMSIAHVWRIVVCYADHFYPHIAHLNTQFIQCMPRLINNAAHGMDHWPVVLDMGLCIAYWIRNLLAGRPIEPVRVASGSKRGRPEEEAEKVAKQRTSAAADVSTAPTTGGADPGADPTPHSACLRRSASPPLEPLRCAGAAAPDVDMQAAGEAGSTERFKERVAPGTAEAAERLASVKLTRHILETLLSTCVRVAIWTDRHGTRPKTPSAQARGGEAAHSAAMWARSMLVLQTLHELLPSTQIKLQAVVVKALKESGDPPAYQVSVISTLLHIATFAHAAPGLLDDILPILSERLPLLFQSADVAVVTDLCTLMRVLLADEAAGAPVAGEKAKFRGEVMHQMAQHLSSVAAESAEPTTLAERASSKNGIVMRSVIVVSLHVLNTMLDAGSTTEQTVDLVHMLPHIYQLFAKFLKQLGAANNNLLSVLATELPLKPGSFLHTFNLLQSMIRRLSVLKTISAVARAPQRVMQSIGGILSVFLQVKVPAEIGPQFATHVVALMDTMLRTSSGPVLKEDTAVQLLRHIVDTLRGAQIRHGFTPPWITDIEQLIYATCSNTGALAGSMCALSATAPTPA